MLEPTVALIANGDLQETPSLKKRIRQFSTIVAIDGGLNHCHHLGVEPTLLIGDFDSADPKILENFSHVPQQRYPKDKDKTDLEIALEQVLAEAHQRVVVFGALGKRIDHTLYNLYLLRRYPGRLQFESNYEQLFAIEKAMELKTVKGQTLSLLPLGEPVLGVTTTGLQWELKNACIDSKSMSISNVSLENRCTVHVAQGVLLCAVDFKEESL